MQFGSKHGQSYVYGHIINKLVVQRVEKKFWQYFLDHSRNKLWSHWVENEIYSIEIGV